jgi:hypothetical protein
MASPSATGTKGLKRWQIALGAGAGLLLGALVGLLPAPWPIVFMGGLLVGTIVLIVRTQRELKRSSDTLREFIAWAEEMERHDER